MESSAANEIEVTEDLTDVSKEKYRPDEIEHLLKISSETRKYSVIKNASQSIKSEVWSSFGFPGKLLQDGAHRIIPGFVSCFTCKKTLFFDGSTKYMIKHKCHQSNLSLSVGKENQTTMDKFLGKKTSLSRHEKDKFKEKLVHWACSSMRPFTVVEDLGFSEIIKHTFSLGIYKDIRKIFQVLFRSKVCG